MSREVVLAEAAAAFNGDDVDVSRQELRKIAVLFDALAKAVREEDQTAFRRLVDVDRLLKQIHRAGLSKWNRFEAESVSYGVRS